MITKTLESEENYDAVLIGAGIMSATLAALLHELKPDMRLLIVERLKAPGLESSSALNNAGTGHAANCELNYTPLMANGQVNTQKAFDINKSFEQSLEFWAFLTERGKLDPTRFLNALPHISLVFGAKGISFLRKRFLRLSSHFAFSEMEWSTDSSELFEWMPLIMEGRSPSQLVGATRVKRGTDVDFGALTVAYIDQIKKSGLLDLHFSTEVVDLFKDANGKWLIELKGSKEKRMVRSPFVFLGAGGGALTLLQKSSIPEGLDYGGFPVSGKWLVCNDKSLASRHKAKVYGNASVGAPPMSVPHLDTRWIDGKRSLLFGPFAGFSSNFLKYGSMWDLFDSVKTSNFVPILQAGLNNLDLSYYLMKQLRLNNDQRLTVLKNFLPNAASKDWHLSVAGQRVQIIKKTSKGGILKMGTEVVTSSDGSLAALLGASPGASTAVTIMLEVLNRCWPENFSTDEWQDRLKSIFPSYGIDINTNQQEFHEIRNRNDSLLGLS